MAYESKNFYNGNVGGSFVDLYTTPTGKESIVSSINITNTDANNSKELTMGVLKSGEKLTVDSIFTNSIPIEDGVGVFNDTRLDESKKTFIGNPVGKTGDLETDGWSNYNKLTDGRYMVTNAIIPTIRLHNNTDDRLIAVKALVLHQVTGSATLHATLKQDSANSTSGATGSGTFTRSTSTGWSELMLYINPSNGTYQERSQYLALRGNTENTIFVTEVHIYPYYYNKPSYESEKIDLNVVGDIDSYSESIIGDIGLQASANQNAMITPVIKWKYSIDGTTWSDDWTTDTPKEIQLADKTRRYVKFGVMWDTIDKPSYTSTRNQTQFLGVADPQRQNNIPVVPSFTLSNVSMLSSPSNKVGMLFNRLQVKAGETISINSAINIPVGSRLVGFCGSSLANTTNYGLNFNINGVEK